MAHLINRVTRRETIQEDHIDGWLDNLFAGMRRMTSHRGAFRNTTGLACVFWAFDLLCLWATFFAFDYRMGFGYLAVGYVVAYAIGTLAPTPGGLGAVEGIMIALYVSFGVPSATAVAVVLTYRLINFWLPIPPGFIAYFVVRPGRHAHPGGRDRGGGGGGLRDGAHARAPERVSVGPADARTRPASAGAGRGRPVRACTP